MPPGSRARSASADLTRCSDARRLLPASVSVSVPVGKSNAASADRPRSGAPGGFQCSRPAIIRCRTRNSSPSRAMTRRLPSLSIARTRAPSTASSGGSTVRNRNGLASRTRSSVSAQDAPLQRLLVTDDVREFGHDADIVPDPSRRRSSGIRLCERGRPRSRRGCCPTWCRSAACSPPRGRTVTRLRAGPGPPPCRSPRCCRSR